MRKSSEAGRSSDVENRRTQPVSHHHMAEGALDASMRVTTQLRRQNEMFGAALDAPTMQRRDTGRDAASTTSLQPMADKEQPALRDPFQDPNRETTRQGTSASDSNDNSGGLPAALRGAMEQESGMSLEDVRVHHNSSAPARVGAHAYAQGRDIHLAPGQERHLPHEAWHVVQQAQGRVQPTMQAAGFAINDNPDLEREADEMGQHVMQQVSNSEGAPQAMSRASFAATPVLQRSLADLNATQTIWNSYNATHAVVNGIVNGDIGALTAAYAHYNGLAAPLNDVQADLANPFLKDSVLGLKHDVAEIDSHAGGYYFQQQVKHQLNAARNILAQTGAHGGVSNTSEPDIIEKHGAAGAKEAHEVKRTTTDDGAKSMIKSAISQLSRRYGFNKATAVIEATSNLQCHFIVNNLATVQGWVIAKMNVQRRGFALDYYHTAPVVAWAKQLIVTVRIHSGVPGHVGVIFDRDFSMALTRQVVKRKKKNGGVTKTWSYTGGHAVHHATRV